MRKFRTKNKTYISILKKLWNRLLIERKEFSLSILDNDAKNGEKIHFESCFLIAFPRYAHLAQVKHCHNI